MFRKKSDDLDDFMFGYKDEYRLQCAREIMTNFFQDIQRENDPKRKKHMMKEFTRMTEEFLEPLEKLVETPDQSNKFFFSV